MAQELFRRNYLVKISDLDNDGALVSFEVRPPFNIGFTCQRRVALANSLNITLMGLGEKKRALLSKRNYEQSRALIIENGELKSEPIVGLRKRSTSRGARELQIELFVAYGDNSNLRRIFRGEIRTAKNTLSGQGFSTEIEAFSNVSTRNRAFTARTITARLEVIEQLMRDAGLEIGRIELVNNDYLRPKVLAGRPIDILRKMANNTTEQFYDDDGKGYFIPVNTPLAGTVVKVNASQGLINTPSRQAEFVNFKCMINPNFKLGGIVELESFVDPTVNGQYKIYDMVFVGDYEGPSWVVDVVARAIEETLLQ
jgi:hypothetical protein